MSAYVDPACGSGAFLISSLRFLREEWQVLHGLRKQVNPNEMAPEGFEDEVVRDLLTRNIYGVDINPASVEIARLALWLHTARGDRPLSSLDDHIREGNSLIGPEFYEGLAPYDDEERERINAFDWHTAFPEVFARGGFDVVVGNPPYVKLQNFRRVHEDMADFLRRRIDAGGQYESTQTGNFDLYLPFIEKGISILNGQGYLAYIAPSLWTVNEYGQGLRQHVMAGRHLWGWIDFGSYQVFDEATTYAALQFFSRKPNDVVSIASSSDGFIPVEPWETDRGLTYGRLTFGKRWLLATGTDRDVIDRLAERCLRLDDHRVTRHIYQGLITSADQVYHLRRLGPGRYECTPKGRNALPYEVSIEDDIMKPLVSGAEAKRYIEPSTDTYLLFPYEVANGRATLMSVTRMAEEFPLAWAYLQSWEEHLRSRENNDFDDQDWYRFGRHQNLDKQEVEKLIVAQTVPSLRLCIDSTARFYLNNVRVNGIVPARDVDAWYLLGVLNGKVCDYVFRRIAKPKDGGWFEANKQFIAPLPIPECDMNGMQAVAECAQVLQELYTQRRNILEEIDRRRSVLRTRNRPESWLFPDLPAMADLRAQARNTLNVEEQRGWAKQRYSQEVNVRHERLSARLVPSANLSAELVDGELRFLVDGTVVVDRVFVDEEEATFIAAQWKVLAASMPVTMSTDGKKLSSSLRRLAVATDNPAAVRQIIDLEVDLEMIETHIAGAELEMNRTLYRLYDLNPDEIRQIERG